jgi:hypothetical protein
LDRLPKRCRAAGTKKLLRVKPDHPCKTLGIACLSVCAFIFMCGVIWDKGITMAFQQGLGVYFAEFGKKVIELVLTAASLAFPAELTKIYLRARARRTETNLTAQMELA